MAMMALGLNACASPMASGGTNRYLTKSNSKDIEPKSDLAQLAACLLFEPISWSSRDTDQTIYEIKKHNRRMKLYCKE